MNLASALASIVSGGIGRALGNRNYRIWTTANAVSLIGTWVQRVAVGWLTWELTKSGTWLGIVAAAEFFPSILVSPLGGAAADRMDRMAQTRICQILLTIQSIVLGVLTVSEVITPVTLALATVVYGVLTAFNQPARLSLVSTLVRREDIAAAVAINSILWNGSRIIGPVIAGFLIVWVGAGWSFMINAASTIFFLLAIALIRLPPVVARPKGAGMLSEIVEGFSYVYHHRAIGSLMILLLCGAVFARPFTELLPGFADDVFSRGADGLALLNAAVGVGATAGGLWLGQRGRVAGQTGMAIWTTLLLSLALLAFTATDNFALSLVALVVAGFGMVVGGITSQSLIQNATEPAMLGRVLSLYGLSFRAGPALGAMIMGVASDAMGLRLPVAIGAALCVLCWLWAYKRRRQMEAVLEA